MSYVGDLIKVLYSGKPKIVKRQLITEDMQSKVNQIINDNLVYISDFDNYLGLRKRSSQPLETDLQDVGIM